MAAAIGHEVDTATHDAVRSLVITTKASMPPITPTLAVRPRVRRLISERVGRHRIVVVSATAGAGKTTAVAESVRELGHPVAWLTVDRTDIAPGRLITYLEAAIARALPDLPGVVRDALAGGLGHVEAAGLLGDAVVGVEFVLVLDDLERLDDEADPWSVIDALLRYAGPAVHAVLISRREIPSGLSCMRPATGATATVDEGDLAFTADEAGRALALLGRDAGEAEVVVEATGGWVTGVLFEAWRADGHVAGSGGGADPLHGYLSAHILGQLSEADCDFLIGTSLLEEVTVARSIALGHPDAGERLAALRAAHLPVLWRALPLAMRCHPRLREYLLTLLERRPADAVRSLRRRHAAVLEAEGQYEEATEEFLRADALEEALRTAERSIFTVVERLDTATAERWLSRLAPVATRGANLLTEAELMLAFTRLDIARAVRIGDSLEHEQLMQLAGQSGRASAFLAWTLLDCGRIDDARAVLGAAPEGPAVDALRYRFWLAEDLEPGGEPVRPSRRDPLFDPLVLITDYLLGRLLVPEDAPASSWGELVAVPWQIAMVRAHGQTQRALDLLEAAKSFADRPHEVGLRILVEPEVLIDAGRQEEAREALARGRRLAEEDGSVSLIGLNALAEVKLLLRLDRDPKAAREILDRLEAAPGARAIAWGAEIIDAFYGFALLLEDRDGEALARLRRAVEGMVTGHRILELPAAATYLSEAEWRAGDEDAADRAADLALSAARRQGSNHLLLQALADMPSVASRRIDAEPQADSAWHALGHALIARDVRLSAQPAASVRFRDWDERSIEIDGQPVRPRVAKSYEVLGYLLGQPDRAADRDELLAGLFDGRADDSTRAYLRQAIGSLRSLLPEGALTTSSSGLVQLAPELPVSSTSARLEAALAEASRLQGPERLAALERTLGRMETGEYLPGGTSRWIDDRRAHFADLITHARLQAAELAFESGALDRASVLVDAVLEADPYRETAWRLKMRIASAYGDDDAVIRVYNGLARALGEIGATPAPSSTRLLDALRR